jgi:hypothetical protein
MAVKFADSALQYHTWLLDKEGYPTMIPYIYTAIRGFFINNICCLAVRNSLNTVIQEVTSDEDPHCSTTLSAEWRSHTSIGSVWMWDCFTSRSRIFPSHGEANVASEGLQNLGLCLAIRTFEQESTDPYRLLWHGGLIFPISSEGAPIKSLLTTWTQGDNDDLRQKNWFFKVTSVFNRIILFLQIFLKSSMCSIQKLKDKVVIQ